MAVGEGAHQLGCDLGAADRRDGDAQGVLEDGDVEPGKMHELEGTRVSEQTREIGAGVAEAAEGLGTDLHHVRGAVSGGKLHQTQPVAMRIEAHRFGVDGHDGTERKGLGQIVPVQVDGSARHELRCAHCDGAQEKTSNFHDLAATGT